MRYERIKLYQKREYCCDVLMKSQRNYINLCFMMQEMNNYYYYFYVYHLFVYMLKWNWIKSNWRKEKCASDIVEKGKMPFKYEKTMQI